MPTARELLEQADALMRRNRANDDDDFPVLTDAVPSVQEAKSQFAPRARPGKPVTSDAGDDVPLLTDEIEEIEAALSPEAGEGEPSVWLDFQHGEPSIVGEAPDSIAIVPPVDMKRPASTPDLEEFDELDEELAAKIAAAPSEDEMLRPPPAPKMPAETEAQARAVESPAAMIAGGAAALLKTDTTASPVAIAPAPAAPEQPAPAAPAVLQRIDLFTDTGLRTQLGERLQPIVDRASADLVATINQHVGELLRAYVAEAIEREIDSWRKEH